MPYISAKDDRRKKLREGDTAKIAGELNYQIFHYVKHNFDGSVPYYSIEYTIKQFVNNFLGKKPNYQKYNDMVGALTLCYKEIRRRLRFQVDIIRNVRDSYDDEIAKYEDLKVKENGDVE